jgi:Domain of unknown function (DUF1707)/Domain of unknown function (DUF4190)
MPMNDNDRMLIPDDDVPPLAGTGPIVGDERALRTTVPQVVRSAGRTWASGTGGEREKMRASDTDRDRVTDLLNAAYSAGRLSKDEYDTRLENAFAARTYADLDQLVSDLPVTRAAMKPAVATTSTVVTLVTKTNRFAIASVVCGLAQFVVGPLATIPAIVFGHMARRQIKHTGQRGGRLALAGLILGWASALLCMVALLGWAIATGGNGTLP